MANDIGDFASAAAATLPPDDHNEPSIFEPKPAKQETSKPPEKVAEKAPEPEKVVTPEKAAPEKRVNPNLAEKEATPPTATDLDEDKRPDGMTDKAFVSWKKIREGEKAANKRATEMEAKVKDFEAKLAESSKIGPEHEALKKELADTKQRLTDYEGELNIARVESTRQFKERIGAPMEHITTSVTKIATRYEMNPEILLRAIQEPDEDKRADLLEEATVDLKRADQLQLVQTSDKYHDLQRQASDMRKNAASELERITREAKEGEEKAATENITNYRSAVSEQWKAVQELIPEIRKVEGNQGWNDYIDSLQREVDGINVNDLDIGEVAKMAAHYKVMPEVLSVLKHFKEENTTLKEQLKAEKERSKGLRAATPGAGSGGASRENGGKKDNGLFADVVMDT